MLITFFLTLETVERYIVWVAPVVGVGAAGGVVSKHLTPPTVSSPKHLAQEGLWVDLDSPSYTPPFHHSEHRHTVPGIFSL